MWQMKKLGFREVESLAQHPTATCGGGGVWFQHLQETTYSTASVPGLDSPSLVSRGVAWGTLGLSERGRDKEVSSEAWPWIPLHQGRLRFPCSGAVSGAERRAGSHFPGYSSRKLQVPRIAWAFFYL